MDDLEPKASDEDDHTVMVDRGVPVEDDDGADHTVMVDRGVPVEGEDADDHTVMVDRGVAADADDGADHTVMVDRGVLVEDDGADHTVMVDRGVPVEGEDADDHTVAVDRAASATPLPSQPGKATRASRRRGIAPPPVPAGFAPQAVEAAGVDAREHYRPRDIPEPPPAAPVIVEGPAATREASATMPSVARHARVTARVAVVVFAASCVASVVGLTLIALAIF